MVKHLCASSAISMMVTMSGCVSWPDEPVGITPIGQNDDPSSIAERQIDSVEKEVPFTNVNVVSDYPFMAIEREETRAGAWLRDKKKRVTFTPIEPLNGLEVLKALRAEGINVTSSMPLKSYTYSGLGVFDVTQEAALRMILGSMGLDYEADDEYKLCNSQTHAPEDLVYQSGQPDIEI